jgi:hypothetical protein
MLRGAGPPRGRYERLFALRGVGPLFIDGGASKPGASKFGVSGPDRLGIAVDGLAGVDAPEKDVCCGFGDDIE